MNEVAKLISLSGLEQKEFAKKVNEAESNLSVYKTGKKTIGLNKLKKWCEILNIDIKYLF